MDLGEFSDSPFVVGASPFACFSELLTAILFSLAVGSYMFLPTSRFRSIFDVVLVVALASVSAFFFPSMTTESAAGCHG